MNASFLLRAAPICALSLLCVGCLAKYEAVTNGGSSTVVMTRSAMHLGRTSLQTYDAFSNDSCTKAASRGRLSALLTNGIKASKSTKVASGEAIYIQATTSMWGGRRVEPDPGTVAISEDRCINFFWFTPLPGHQYELKQQAPTLSECSVEVTDLATQLPPEDLTVGDAQHCSII